MMTERPAAYAASGQESIVLFVLSLPPTANHQYDPIKRYVKGRLVHGKRWSDDYTAWRDEAALEVKGWEPEGHIPLAVSIDLYIPSRLGRNCDIDGFIKPILDAVVGKAHDQWVDYLRVRRHPAKEQGRVEVVVREMVERAMGGDGCQ